MKQKVMNEYINALNEKLESAKKSHEIAKHDTIEAEGRMVTRYDSTKTETAWLADGYLRTVKELESVIQTLQENTIFANVGDCVDVTVYQRNEFIGEERIVLSKELSKDNQELFVKIIGSFVHDRISDKRNGEIVEYHVRNIEKTHEFVGVKIYAIVTLEDEDGMLDYYFLVNNNGGIEINVDGKEIYCVSKQAPIAVEMLTKSIGDIVRPHGNKGVSFRIRSIE